MNIIPLVEDGFDVSRDSRTTAASVSGATVIPVGDYVSKFVAGNRVAVTLSDASTQANTIASVQTAAKTITLGTALSGAASLGGLIRVRVIDTLSGGMDFGPEPLFLPSPPPSTAPTSSPLQKANSSSSSWKSEDGRTLDQVKRQDA